MTASVRRNEYTAASVLLLRWSFSRLLTDKIASAEYQYLGGMNHFVHFENPATLAASVMPFLRTFAR